MPLSNVGATRTPRAAHLLTMSAYFPRLSLGSPSSDCGFGCGGVQSSWFPGTKKTSSNLALSSRRHASSVSTRVATSPATTSADRGGYAGRARTHAMFAGTSAWMSLTANTRHRAPSRGDARGAGFASPRFVAADPEEEDPGLRSSPPRAVAGGGSALAASSIAPARRATYAERDASAVGLARGPGGSAIAASRTGARGCAASPPHDRSRGGGGPPRGGRRYRDMMDGGPEGGRANRARRARRGARGERAREAGRKSGSSRGIDVGRGV